MHAHTYTKFSNHKVYLTHEHRIRILCTSSKMIMAGRALVVSEERMLAKEVRESLEPPLLGLNNIN